jgi:uncharacterized protein involved in cysteine biosynthesis
MLPPAALCRARRFGYHLILLCGGLQGKTMARWVRDSFAFRFLKGAGCLLRAAGMVLSSRRIFLFSALPFLICLGLYVVLLIVAIPLDRHIVGLILGPGAWWRTLVRALLAVATWLALFVVGLFTYTAACFTLAGALYDLLTVAVERRLTGTVVEAPSGLKLVLLDNWRALVNSLKILLVTLLAWAVSLIAPPVTTVLAAVVSGALLGLQCCDYQLVRRRMAFRDKLRYARHHFWEMLGLGLPLLFALAIPFAGAAFLPIGVIGGTILYLDLANGPHHDDTTSTT